MTDASQNTAQADKAPFSDGSGLRAYRTETLKRFEFAIRRDHDKGGDGLRTTRDVADWNGVRAIQAARLLEAMERAGEVECIGKLSGNRLWAVTDFGLSALAREGASS